MPPHPLRALFLDMDSFFASAEQHLEPHLRGKAIGVAPMLTESTCCIAASYSAKAFGVKTGTGVAEARRLCPGIQIVEARPPAYVDIHHQIIEVIESCIHVDHVLSIDEMLCWLPNNWRDEQFVFDLGMKIKTRLCEHFSEAITCSIGIAPNGWLAKVASKMRKPDGLFIIRGEDLPQALYPLQLSDLHGVGKSMERRLHTRNIHSVKELCNAPREALRAAWGSVEGQRIWHKLRGEAFDDYDTPSIKRSMSHGHVLPPALRPQSKAIAVVHRLLQKVALRMRHHGLLTGAMDLSLRYANYQRWSGTLTFPETDDSLILTKIIKQIWKQRPDNHTPVKKLNIVLHRLVQNDQFTPSLFEQHTEKRAPLNEAMDQITNKFGKQALYLGGAHNAMNHVTAKIAFNHIPDVDIEA